MFLDIFSSIDNILIEKCFQPACDCIRKELNWTKGVPTAVALIIAIIGLAPIATAAFIIGYSLSWWIFFIPAGIMLLWILVSILQAARLIFAGFRSEIGASTRLTGKKDRQWMMIFSIIALLIILADLITYPDTDIRTVIAIPCLISCIANMCASYFKACTDSSE